MREPSWLAEHFVVSIHSKTVHENGGLHGIRDKGLLQSALARPQQQFNYSKSSIFELAAAYAFAIAKNHPFMDGNKRTAIISAGVFLRLNGFSLEVEEVELVEKAVSLAAGNSSEKDFSVWLEENSKKLKHE